MFTWSHLEVLAAERDPQRRSTLLHDVEQENLFVRELREERGGVAAPEEQATPRCVPTYMREIQALNQQADALARHEEWAPVLQKIGDAPPDLVPLLRAALDLQRRVQAESETIINLLQRAIGSAERRGVSPSPPVGSDGGSVRH